ncbi:MAG: hypothetical protein EA417_13415 [Gammaproteobacteria bacterium]|nr:MAG: hypothetical protein EA417_13415 [Gammaproteobacteria bacterium]
MKIETLGELLNWCDAIHSELAERMTRSADQTPEGPARWLMQYAAKHEAQMAEQLEGIEQVADQRALKTWVYDWLEHPPPKPETVVDGADRERAFEAVGRAVFDAHNEIMTVLKFLIDRADTPEAKELIEQMLSLEEGHTRQIGQQMHRIRDM